MNPDINTDAKRARARRDLLNLYAAALQQVNGEHSVSAWLSANSHSESVVIAIGKAAPAMMRGALQQLGSQLHAALVITRQGYADPSLFACPQILQLEAAHPVPDESSLEAGRQLLTFIARQPLHLPLLFLISGGASSLAEVLHGDVGLADLQRLNRWLLGSDMDIEQMNLIRRGISGIKGGGLRCQLAGRKSQVLLISDVPGDDPAIIGSGLLYAPPQSSIVQEIPSWIAARMRKPKECEHPLIPHHVIASSAQAVAAAAIQARSLGYDVFDDYPLLQGNAEQQGETFARLLINASPGVHIMGGETTMKLPPDPGRGGRNQHLALVVAREIAGNHDVVVLAAGTDGSDGSGDDAGALIDGYTWGRVSQQGFDPQQALARADSGTVLEATGDLLVTGPTGTNVMDLLIGLRMP